MRLQQGHSAMADTDWITCTDTGAIRQLVLNAPPVNALRPERLMGLAEVIEAAQAAEHIRAIVLSSALRVFSAGLDLKEAVEFDQVQQDAVVEGLNIAFLRLFACSKPVIVAANGAAIAGGLFFVLAADHRVVSPRAVFGLAEVRVGVDFPVGPMEIARAMLAPNDLRRLMMRGQPITAEQALAMGLIDQLVPEEMLIDTAMQDAREFAAIPPAAYAAVKRQIRGETIARITAHMADSRDAWFTAETRGAMTAMLEGRHGADT
jgi:enoyl-CoA hydratase/carnithine racemase